MYFWISEQVGLSLDDALDFFYRSQQYPLLKEGVSDLHCMSGRYLAEELEIEYRQTMDARPSM